MLSSTKKPEELNAKLSLLIYQDIFAPVVAVIIIINCIYVHRIPLLQNMKRLTDFYCLSRKLSEKFSFI